MSEMSPEFRRVALLRAGGLALAGAFAFGSWAATAVPAQVPLVSRVVNPPPPNVVIDIDDSGSMQAHYMPEGAVRIDTGTTVYAQPFLPKINLMTDLVDVFVNDQINRVYTQAGIPKGTSGAVTQSVNVFQRQMRSSDVNSIFYNPAVLYQPWLQADGMSRMVPGVYTAAYWNIADPTIKNPTTDLSQVQQVNSNWCDSSTSAGSTCSTATTQLYNPGLFYVLHSDGKTPPTYDSDPNSAGSYTEYDLNGSATAFPAAAARVCTPAPGSGCCPAAGASGCSVDQERQNFANWFVYYRSRTHLVKGSLSETLPGAVGKIRAAWGTINSPAQIIDGQSTRVLKTGIRDLDTTQLATIMSGYQGINPSGSTPLRKATQDVGEYFRWQGSSSPWNQTPGTLDNTPASCRRSYHLLMTDGYYNDSVTVPDVDSKPGPSYANANPLGESITQYLPSLPYADNQANMLADVAMQYFVNDLQTGIDNRVLANDATGDIAFWQHVGMFTVGLGVQGQLNWNIDPTKSDLPALTAGTKTWGTDRIDDLWHAAVDTHGMYFSAKDSTTLASALKTALGSAGSTPLSDSGAATSSTSTSLTTSTFAYIPSYRAVQWTGDIAAYPIDPVTGQRAATASWSASSKLPAFGARNIFTYNGSVSVPFNTSMDPALKKLVDPSTATQDLLINYIRGDSSNESSVGYRPRVRTDGGVLGDFLDSAPTFVQNFVNLGYGKLTSAPGYDAWFSSVKAGRKTGVLFEGANDGMLHAFEGTTGAEIYAYIPKVLLPNLVTLSQQDYGVGSNVHRDYVDGPQVETDAYIATKRAPLGWANLVMGTYGAGARGFYAIDTTSLPTLDDKSLLWELTNANDPDIGYMFNPPATGVLPAAPVSTGALANGSWKAFVGNGVYSDGGAAVLLIVDLATGKIDKVSLGSGPDNGLMGVKLLLDDANQVVAAYAGDLKGNVYRVEFTGANAPVESFNKSPLFTAVGPSGVPQPITAPPNVYPNPSATGGNIVLVGTGRLIDIADADTFTTQTFYGILDPTIKGATAEGTNRTAPARDQLVQQVVTPSTNPVGFFAVTSNPVDYSQKAGWFMDLNVVGATQRVIYPSTLIGDFVLINTTQPAPLSRDPCLQTSGSSAYFLLPALDGAAYTKAPVWDVDDSGTIDPGGDGSKGDTIDTADGQTQAAGYSSAGAGQTSIVMMPPATSSPTGAPVNTMVNIGPGSDKEGATYCLYDCGKTIQKRVWQQLMTPPF